MVINAREVGSRCEVRRPLDTLRIKGEKVGSIGRSQESGVRSLESLAAVALAMVAVLIK